MADSTAKRTCRVCGRTYDYPEPGSLATRTACESCVSIPKDVRRALSTMRSRIDRMSREIERLKSDRPAS